MPSRYLFGCVVCAGLLGASGCALPVSEMPLTDEKTSTLDERLIGFWTYVPKEKEEKAPPVPYVIGRMKDQPNVLQMTWIELENDQAKVRQMPLYATKIGDEHYLSLQMNDKDAGKEGKEEEKPAFLIARYELNDEGAGKLYIMNGQFMAAAIENGKLKGVVRRAKRKEGGDPNEATRFEEVRITAEPKDLTAFLKTHGKACYTADEHLAFQRTKSE